MTLATLSSLQVCCVQLPNLGVFLPSFCFFFGNKKGGVGGGGLGEASEAN